MSIFKLHPQGITAVVRLKSDAKTTCFQGRTDIADGNRALKILVKAPPEDGKANAALLAFLSKSWGVQRKHLSILTGEHNRQKVVLIAGDGPALMKKLAAYGN